MRRYRRSPFEVAQEWLLPRPERHAARAERRVEAQMRAERDSPLVAERLAARNLAESQRYKNLGPWQ